MKVEVVDLAEKAVVYSFAGLRQIDPVEFDIGKFDGKNCIDMRVANSEIEDSFNGVVPPEQITQHFFLFLIKNIRFCCLLRRKVWIFDLTRVPDQCLDIAKSPPLAKPIQVVGRRGLG